MLADCLADCITLALRSMRHCGTLVSLGLAAQSKRISNAPDMDTDLPSLPVSALRLAPEIAAALCRVGLKKLGDLLTAPRAPLARRFGAVLMTQLDRITGREDEPISPRRQCLN